MAYDFIPTSESEIRKTLKSQTKGPVDEIVRLFNFLKKDNPTPISIDKINIRKVNVNRKFDKKKGGKYNIQNITVGAKLSLITIRFGNGSAGNRGANNAGAQFEGVFARDIDNWWIGKDKGISDINMKAIESLESTYGLISYKWMTIKPEGDRNTKRPLLFTDSAITITNKGGNGLDIGQTISDITLKMEDPGEKEIYLSLKKGSTVTFFNVGVKTILTKTEIQSGNIKNASGLRLLKLFGIDPVKFCGVFNQTISSEVDSKPKVDAYQIKGLIKSGVGYGYHVIHEIGKTIISKKMDKKAMDTAADVENFVIYYGGMKGGGRRIDITFDSPTYSFKLNIRDTQGGDGYPTRMMLDFNPK